MSGRSTILQCCITTLWQLQQAQAYGAVKAGQECNQRFCCCGPAAAEPVVSLFPLFVAVIVCGACMPCCLLASSSGRLRQALLPSEDLCKDLCCLWAVCAHMPKVL